MTTRPADLQAFLDAALIAFEAHAADPRSSASLAKVRAALTTQGEMVETQGARLPVCSWLDSAVVPEAFGDPDLRRLIEAFVAIEPRLPWFRRGGDMSTASANIADGHANAIIVGPKGIERREDVWIGVSLLAPNVRYPDHNHPPEETYLVLSEGEFRHDDSDWFTPGVGGSFYNEPNIWHAMRTGDAPLFAFWILRVDT